MVVFVFAALFAGFLAPYDPIATNALATLQPPGDAHWLGTDAMGRDMLEPHHLRRAHLARGGLGSTVLGCVFGIVLGLTPAISAAGSIWASSA